MTTTMSTAERGFDAAIAPRYTIDLRSHRNLRGPYTAGGELLRRIVPELAALDPELAKPASTAVVAIAPDLESDVPIRPQTLTDLASGDERTRFYAVQRTRDLAYMVSELVGAWAQACHPEGVILRFWELAEADATDRQLFATLLRRADPALVVIEDASPLLGTFATAAPDPAQRYIDADGTSPDPEERAAYDGLLDADRRSLHSARARLLIDRAAPGDQLGAIPYHMERGEDPQEAVTWLVAGQNQSFREGFYEAALDLGRRGRALVSWDDDPKTHNYLTKRVIGALTYLTRCDEAIAVIDEHRQVTTEVSEQMNDAYMMAMIYTRHMERARLDQDLALAWVNTALALAEGAHDPERHAFYGAFMRNARALVEMHRGNLAGSLRLVNEAIAIADEHLGAEAHALHRTVLINNRARLLLALEDHAGALAGFDEVLHRDPEYDEPYFERAAAHRAHGDVAAALADLDRAIELSVAFTDAYYNRADIRLDLGQDDLALADFDALLDIDPDYVDARLNRGAMLLGQGDLAAAEVDLEHGLKLRPDHPQLWSALGLLRAEQDDEEAALACFEQALELDSDLVEVYGNRAVLHFGAGRFAAAVRDLDRALERVDSAALRLNRAVGRQSLGDHSGALADLDAALAQPDADELEVLYRRGISLAALGRTEAARADWDQHRRRARQLDQISPHDAEIAVRIEQIGQHTEVA